LISGLSKKVYLLWTLSEGRSEIDPAGVIVSCARAGIDLDVCDGHIDGAEGSPGPRAGCWIADMDVDKRPTLCKRRFSAAAATQHYKCADSQNRSKCAKQCASTHGGTSTNDARNDIAGTLEESPVEIEHSSDHF